MNSYKKAEIIDALIATASNIDTVSLYLSHLFKEKKVRNSSLQTLIFQAVLREIGFEAFLTLIMETIDILNSEEPKYLHPKTQEMVRKTPGGVFMSLFKHSEHIEADQKKIVLKELKQNDKNEKRKYRGLLGLMSHLSL